MNAQVLPKIKELSRSKSLEISFRGRFVRKSAGALGKFRLVNESKPDGGEYLISSECAEIHSLVALEMPKTGETSREHSFLLWNNS